MSNESLPHAGQPQNATRSDLRSVVSQLIVAIFFVTLAGRLFRLTSRYAVNIFFWDQWVFNNATLFQKHSLWQMFRWQFGPPRLGLGTLLSSFIEPYFHWNSRTESFLACGIVVLAAACALWLKKRLFGTITIGDVAIPVLYLSASQYESIFVDSDLAHGPLPLLLITLFCLAWTVRNVVARYLLVLALNFVAIYTGFGLFLGFLTPLLLIFDYWENLRSKRHGGPYTAAALLIALASLASFFYGYKLQPAVSCFSLRPGNPVQYFWYASLIFANNLWISGIGFFPRFIGCVAILCLAWTVLAATRKLLTSAQQIWIQNAVPATLAGFCLLFVMNASYGRLCLGLASAHSSRYTNYLALGLFGAYLYLLALPSLKIRRVMLTGAVLVLLATLPIRSADRNTMRWFTDIKRNWKKCYLAGGTISACDAAAGYRIDPEPQPVLQQKLDYLKNTHKNLFCSSK